MLKSIEVFEVRNPSFNDIPLSEQIELGINDWVARCSISGLQVYGETKQKSLDNFDARYYLV
jgi:hypothetical protein